MRWKKADAPRQWNGRLIASAAPAGVSLRQKATNVAFEVSDTPAREPAASYDAILCMAVLRHGALGAPGVTSCEKLIRFENFARTVEDFSRCLRPGGFLVIRHSNFRFCDAPVYSKFETILALPHLNEAATPIFGPDNRLMEGEVYRDTIFRKILP
jgi:hypothetical protein